MNGKLNLVKVAVLLLVIAAALAISRSAAADGISIGYYNGPNGQAGYSVSLGFGGGYYGNRGYYGAGYYAPYRYYAPRRVYYCEAYPYYYYNGCYPPVGIYYGYPSVTFHISGYRPGYYGRSHYRHYPRGAYYSGYRNGGYYRGHDRRMGHYRGDHHDGGNHHRR